jgi:hypothetical protein
VKGVLVIGGLAVVALYVLGVTCRKASLVPKSGDHVIGHIKVGLDRMTGNAQCGRAATRDDGVPP